MISRGASKTILSMDQYDKIAIGMPYEAVRAIIGFDGTEDSTVGDMSTYVWKDGGGKIVCVFTNGFVSAKTHSGLKP